MQSIYHCQVKYAITFSPAQDKRQLRAESKGHVDLQPTRSDPLSSIISAWLQSDALDIL